MNLFSRDAGFTRLAIDDGHHAILDTLEIAAQGALAVPGLVHADLDLVPGPVGEILHAGQRAVDPRRADFEVIGPVDQHFTFFFERIDPVGNTARQGGALFDHELAGLRILGHDLKGLPAISGFGRHHLDAHKFEAERLGFGFDHFGQTRQIGHSFSKSQRHRSDRASWPAPRGASPSSVATMSGMPV